MIESSAEVNPRQAAIVHLIDEHHAAPWSVWSDEEAQHAALHAAGSTHCEKR